MPAAFEPGPYELQAAINAVRATPTAPPIGAQIRALRSAAALAPSPIGRAHRAVAVAVADGPSAALAHIKTSTSEYYLVWEAEGRPAAPSRPRRGSRGSV